MTEKQELFRWITSILVVASTPPLLLLVVQLIKDFFKNRSFQLIQVVLLVVYLTFLVSGGITLYLNIQLLFLGATTSTINNELALIRNLIKHVGVLFISWALLYITRQRR